MSSLPVARVEELEGILREELEPEEAFQVVWREGSPRVEPTVTPEAEALEDVRPHHALDRLPCVSPRADLPDELRGVLLSANQAINDAGMWVLFSGLIAIETACVGTHLGWWSSVGPLAVRQLQSGWVYLLLHLVGVCLFAAVMQLPERRVYRRQRALVHEAMERSGLNRFQVIGRIADDSTLSCVAGHLKRDHDLD